MLAPDNHFDGALIALERSLVLFPKVLFLSLDVKIPTVGGNRTSSGFEEWHDSGRGKRELVFGSRTYPSQKSLRLRRGVCPRCLTLSTHFR